MSVLDLTEKEQDNELDFKSLYNKISAIENNLIETNERLNKTAQMLSMFVNLSLRKVNNNNQLYLPEDVTHYIFQQLTMEKDAVNTIYKMLSEIRSN